MHDLMNSLVQKYSEREPYVSASAIAKHLGLNVFTVYKMAQRNQIPSHKFGKSRRFKKSEVESKLNGECR